MSYVCPLTVPAQLIEALRGERFAFPPRATDAEVDLAGASGVECAGVPRLVDRDWLESAMQLVLGRYKDRPATTMHVDLAQRGELLRRVRASGCCS